METNELENLKRNKLFEDLKGKCKSCVKRDLYGLLLCWPLIILLFFATLRQDNPKSILFFICWIVIFCLGGWLTFFIFRFFKKVDNLDTPDRLLYWFEKRHRYNLIAWLVSCIGIIGAYLINFGSIIWVILGAAIFIVIIVLIYYSGGPLWYHKEKDIIEQLRELVEKK